ncbi:MAG TPA: transposase [Bacillota bacterium]|nr:transposase [Bacillota bacterium]
MGNYSIEYKKEICKRITDGGEKVSHVCAEQNLVENTVRSWLRIYKERSGQAFVGSGNIKPEEIELKRLQRENRELREENEILKKAAAYFARNVK